MLVFTIVLRKKQKNLYPNDFTTSTACNKIVLLSIVFNCLMITRCKDNKNKKMNYANFLETNKNIKKMRIFFITLI